MKKKTLYKCSSCGYTSNGFFGKCPGCGEWNTLVEVDETPKSSKLSEKVENAKPLGEIQARGSERVLTGIEEFNRVMGGGIVKDSISIITAKPGAGKSTLLLQVANDLATKGLKILYASGEESESQIRSRADRILDKISDNLFVYSTNIMDYCLEEIERIDPDFIIIDSIQTFILKEIQSRPATPTQVMECAHKMVEVAKGSRPRMVFLVGQMTKEDELAGVRALEHLVDTVILLESENNEQLRSLVATKNRYGSTGEMGFFIMDEKGLVSLDNPSEYFMTERKQGEELPGSALSVVKEGTRPIILEIEALASTSFLPYPSRISECMRREHLNTLISILEQRANLKLMDKNVVIKTTGGIKLKETASNLAVMISIFSSLKNIAIDTSTIFIADVGLTGELKGVPSLDERLREAERMGFKRAFIAPIKHKKTKLEIVECKTISEVINKLQK
ncbi:DNA repair protein RadA/Sms [Peptoniphilus asaccharolyticus DSM 20463]|uniref:DNA repair protein RadA n=1 Tax=Peptoniphilus asaccharolyticus DSM 20463 TaxID=573058 RepID=A0A1W1ULN5_PEPAS|nr:DNA repair protein RadA [Peptoniphilus asaccharolyticus]MBL7574871.1 DNA repair protein RadA [Peptoniphilus asaccharolyticus]SMB81933.1 DNA repair protein RadA/Sms [Peptoniphilus asaccharolyticus DSM 20463]